MAAEKSNATLSVQDTALTVSCVGMGSVGCQLVDGGSFSGTVTFEATIDGANWVAIKGTPVASITGASTATGAGIWQFPVAGMNLWRARLSTASAGSIVISVQTCDAIVTKFN